MSFKFSFITAALLIITCCNRQEAGMVPHALPESQGMDSGHLALIDSTVQASVEAGDIPGAVVSVVRNGNIVYEKAFGYKAVVPQKDTMKVETLFDLASISKCVGTTLSFMQLVERGQVRLVDPVRYYIPDFQPWEDPETGEKVHITVQDLLTHASGLSPYLESLRDYLDEFGPNSPDSLVHFIATRTERHFRPKTEQMYSCLNFITLQAILEKVTGERLCDYAQRHVFDVLGLSHTTYFPVDGPVKPELADLCAPTELQADSSILKAQVHDPIARLINGGNSGNAGVFSNVEDLAVISAALLNGGSWNGRRILSPLTVKRMFAIPQDNAPEVARALGWDTYALEPYTSGDVFGLGEIRGHTGYTGTSLIIDPATGTAIIILAHRVHPQDQGSTSRLRSTIASIVAASIGR